jgi:hypothetical protein
MAVNFAELMSSLNKSVENLMNQDDDLLKIDDIEVNNDREVFY